jgi:acyl-CoA dehydrogenase
MQQDINRDLAEMRPALRRFVSQRLEPLSREIDASGQVPPEATEALRERFLPKLAAGLWTAAFALTEPEAGSDAAALRTRAERCDGGWVLDGLKHYISGAHRAQVLLVVALTDARLRARGGMTSFLVERDTPGMSIPRIDKTLGSEPVQLGEVRLDACFVPDSAVLGAVGQGFGVAMELLTSGRMGVACACIGTADRLLELALEHARQRRTFGQPLAKRQAIQWMLADSATELALARALAYETLRRIDAGEPVDAAPSMVKLYCSEMVGRVADRAVQIFGGAGLIRGAPVERFYRDVRHYRIGEGSSEVQHWPVMDPHVAPKQASDGGRLAEKVPAIMHIAPHGYDFVVEIAPRPGDVQIPKKHPSAFFGTALASHLIDQQVDTLIVAGCTTSGCVRGTVVDAFSLNFRVAVA